MAIVMDLMVIIIIMVAMDLICHMGEWIIIIGILILHQHIGIITSPITHTTISRLLLASTSFCNIMRQLEGIGFG